MRHSCGPPINVYLLPGFIIIDHQAIGNNGYRCWQGQAFLFGGRSGIDGHIFVGLDWIDGSYIGSVFLCGLKVRLFYLCS